MKLIQEKIYGFLDNIKVKKVSGFHKQESTYNDVQFYEINIGCWQ